MSKKSIFGEKFRFWSKKSIFGQICQKMSKKSIFGQKRLVTSKMGHHPLEVSSETISRKNLGGGGNQTQLKCALLLLGSRRIKQRLEILKAKLSSVKM